MNIEQGMLIYEVFKNHISLIGVQYSRTPLAVFAFPEEKLEGEKNS